MSDSSQVLDHPIVFKNSLYFNVFSHGAGMREEKIPRALVGSFKFAPLPRYTR